MGCVEFLPSFNLIAQSAWTEMLLFRSPTSCQPNRGPANQPPCIQMSLYKVSCRGLKHRHVACLRKCASEHVPRLQRTVFWRRLLRTRRVKRTRGPRGIASRGVQCKTAKACPAYGASLEAASSRAGFDLTKSAARVGRALGVSKCSKLPIAGARTPKLASHRFTPRASRGSEQRLDAGSGLPLPRVQHRRLAAILQPRASIRHCQSTVLA